MVKKVKANIMELEEKFDALVVRAEKHLCDTMVGLRELRQAITRLPTYLIEYKKTKKFVKQNKKEFLKAKNIEEVFITANDYWDFLNYSLLQHIINRFGSNDMRKEMETFATEILVFRKKTRIKPFSKVYKIRCDFKNDKRKKIVSELKEIDFSTATLEDVEKYRSDLCSELSLPEFSLQLAEIQDGSMMLTWLVSKSLVAHVQKTIKPSSPTMKKHNVSLFIVDGFVAYYSSAGN